VRVLGLNVSGYISSAAVVQDGRVVAAAPEERFSRLKRDRNFPARAARWAIREAGWEPADLDAVAIGWNPSRNLTRDLGLLRESNRLRGLYYAYVPNSLAGVFGWTPEETSEQRVFGRRVIYVDHHLAHAASAAFTSPFDHGAVVTIDAFGEEDSLAVGRFAGNRIEVLDRVLFPHSLGAFYSYFTEFLGFTQDSEEYKVMALGAYGDPDRGRSLLDRVRTLYRVDGGGDRLDFRMDLARFDHYLFHRSRNFGPLAEVVGMRPRHRQDDLGPDHFALAWAMQRAFEEIVGEVLRYARRVTGESRVALAGGCFMNSLANGRLEHPGAPFQDIHIPAWPDDSGTSIGAALYAALQGTELPREALHHSFLGPGIDGEEARQALRRRGLPFDEVADPSEEVAALCAAGEIVGAAQGPMEFGQRALGHRSIFADPRIPDVRDRVNRQVKRREWFRPYAASVLAHRVHEVFDAPEGFRSDVMEKVRPVRAAWADRISGLLHADGTVRVHTVDDRVDPWTASVIRAFEARTGVPLLLNTSFNVAGMPIVCSPDDAAGCFLECGLESLVLGPVRVRKADFGPRGPR
jgi:carbamoyltransferase